MDGPPVLLGNGLALLRLQAPGYERPCFVVEQAAGVFIWIDAVARRQCAVHFTMRDRLQQLTEMGTSFTLFCEQLFVCRIDDRIGLVFCACLLYVGWLCAGR